ncbi:MAG: diadenylate cyclase CdaA [Prochlorotrichaceae cyanobacterium]
MLNPDSGLLGKLWDQWLSQVNWHESLSLQLVDLGLVLLLAYAVLVIIGERRTLWMVRGFIILTLFTAISFRLRLFFLTFIFGNLLLGSAISIGVSLQSEFRRFLEQLGQFHILELFQPSPRSVFKSSDIIEEIVDAVKELSQSRTGALIILETEGTIDDRDFSVPGVRLNAEISKELLQTIFQTSTMLHDGAVLIRSSRLMAAGVILPISERSAVRRLGTRHRAAMGITERVDGCLCVVVSEETGSISVAEKGLLNRPLTSSKLKELLEMRFSPSVDRDSVAPNLRNLGLQLRQRLRKLFTASQTSESKDQL